MFWIYWCDDSIILTSTYLWLNNGTQQSTFPLNFLNVNIILFSVILTALSQTLTSLSTHFCLDGLWGCLWTFYFLWVFSPGALRSSIYPNIFLLQCLLFVCFHPSIDILLFTQLRVVGNWTAHQSVTNMFCIVNQNDVFHILVWGCHIKAKYLHVPQLLQHLTEVPARHYPLCPMVLSRCPDAADVLDFVVFWFIAEFLPFFYHIFSLVQLVLFSLSGCD